MPNKYTGLNWVLSVGEDTIGPIVDAFSNTVTADVIDVTDISQNFKEKIKGQVDPGEWTFSVYWDDASESIALLGDLLSDNIGGGTLPVWTLTPSQVYGPTPGTISFSAFLSGLNFSTGGPQDKATVEITLTVSGDPGHITN